MVMCSVNNRQCGLLQQKQVDFARISHFTQSSSFKTTFKSEQLKNWVKGFRQKIRKTTELVKALILTHLVRSLISINSKSKNLESTKTSRHLRLSWTCAKKLTRKSYRTKTTTNYTQQKRRRTPIWATTLPTPQSSSIGNQSSHSQRGWEC